MGVLLVPPPYAPRSGARAVLPGDPDAACTVQAIAVETFRKNGSQTTKSTDFYPGDGEIYVECRYRSTCAPNNPAMPLDIGFQLDGTTFHYSSSADSKKLTTDEYLAAGHLPLPAAFTPDVMWPHSHAAGCEVDASHKLSEDASDNWVQRAVIFRPKPPEPTPPSEVRPPDPVPGMTLTAELRFIGVKPHEAPAESPAVAVAPPAAEPEPETARAPARAAGVGATSDEDQRAQLVEERQRAQDYLARLRRTPPGGDRPPAYEPHFPGIERPVHLTSVPQMENYLRMVEGRLAMVNERAAQPSSPGRGAPAAGSAERTTPPVPPAAPSSPPGSAVATPDAHLFGARVPYRFTDVHPEVRSALLDCGISTAGIGTAVGWGRAVVELDGKDRSGVAQMTFQPYSGHTVSELGKARFYRCVILMLDIGSESHAVLKGSPDPVILPAWAAASSESVLSVEGRLAGRR